MSFFSRLGTDPHQFNIETTIDKLNINPPKSENPLIVRLIRGNKLATTDTQVSTNGTYTFKNKTLQCNCTLYKKKDKYLEKECRLAVFQILKGSIEKEIARIDFNISEYVKSSGEFTDNKTFKLDKLNGTINVKLRTKYLDNITHDNDKEVSVSRNSETSDNDNEYKEKDNNTTNKNNKSNTANGKPNTNNNTNKANAKTDNKWNNNKEDESDEEEDEDEDDVEIQNDTDSDNDNKTNSKKPQPPNARNNTNTNGKPTAANNNNNKGKPNAKPPKESDEEEEEDESDEDNESDEDTKKPTNKNTNNNTNKPNNNAKSATIPTNNANKPKSPANNNTNTNKTNKSKPESESEGENDSDDESSDDSNQGKKHVQFNNKPIGSTNPSSNTTTGTNTINPPKPNLKLTSPPPITSPKNDRSNKRGEKFFQLKLDKVHTITPPKAQLDIPFILHLLFERIEENNGLQTEGIFKVAPNQNAKDKLIKQIDEVTAYTDLVSAINEVYDPILLASIVKHWLTSLPEPIIPTQLNQECLDIGARDIDNDEKGAHSDNETEDNDDNDNKQSKSETIRASLSKLIPKLPTLNRSILLAIANIVTKLTQPNNTRKNKMTLQALSVIFAPALLRINKEGKEAYELFLQSQFNAKFFEHLVKYKQALVLESDNNTNKGTAGNRGQTTSTKPQASNKEQSSEDEDESDSENESDEDNTTKPDTKPKSNTTATKLPPGAVATPLMAAAQIAADKKNANQTKPNNPPVPATTSTTNKPDNKPVPANTNTNTNNKSNTTSTTASNTNKGKPTKPESDNESSEEEEDDDHTPPTKSTTNANNNNNNSEAIASLTAELNKLKLENEQLKKNTPTTNASSDNKKSIEKLTKEKESIEKEHKQLNEKYNKLKKEYDENKKKSEDEIKKLKSNSNNNNSTSSKSLFGSNKERDTEINNLRIQLESIQNENSKLKNDNKLLKIQLNELQDSSHDTIETLTNLRNGLTQQVDVLKTENDNLRGRILSFDELTIKSKELDTAKKNKDKNKQQYTLLQAYEQASKRIKFLESAIKESDETLIQARQTWHVTNKVLQDLTLRLEAELALANNNKDKDNENKSIDEIEAAANEKKLIKLNKKYNSLAESYNILELQLTKTKQQLQTANNIILQLQDDNKKINSQLIDTGIALKTIADDNFELKEFMRLNVKGQKKNKKLVEQQANTVSNNNNNNNNNNATQPTSSPESDNSNNSATSSPDNNNTNTNNNSGSITSSLSSSLKLPSLSSLLSSPKLSTTPK